MNDAIRNLMARYSCQTREDYLNALREILQELALLGLWRAKFFDHAAFCGGTALRVIYGIERYSEDLDFSLLMPTPDFSLQGFGDALEREIGSYGFNVVFEKRIESANTAVESAFLKANTVREMIYIDVGDELLFGLHPGTQLKIKIEIDLDPPGGFATETKYLLEPIAFPVQIYTLPELFSGKLHAVLCRRWKSRVKGRDWFDLVWFAGRHPEVNMPHLEERMRQSGHWMEAFPLDFPTLTNMLMEAVNKLDFDQARSEVIPFVRDRRSLEVWSREFFLSVIGRIRPVGEFANDMQ